MENNTSIKSDSFIDSWMQIAAAAKKEVLARNDLDSDQQRIDACEKIAISHSLKNLMSYPWIQRRVKENNLNLAGCYYDLRTGELAVVDEIK